MSKHKKINSILKIIFIISIVIVFGVVFLMYKTKSVIPPDNKISIRCTETDAPYFNANLSIEERVDDLMKRMTVWEKVGQMVLVEKNSIKKISDITKYNLGALLSGGGAGPKEETPLAWLQMINDFQSATKDTCLKIPLLYGIDAVHGHGNVLGATIFPHAIALGATRDADLVRRVAEATAEEMVATGIYWSYSPNLDVAKDIRWGKTYETFGSDTSNVADLGVAYLKGTQDSSENYFKVLATLKHFVGGGHMEYGTSRNKDFKVEEGNITLDENILRDIHILPFKKAIDAGARVVMVGTATWNETLNSSNEYLLTEVLKKEFGFSGFIVSDWYGVYQISPSKYESLVTAINAGVDMVMTPFDYKEFMINMQKAINDGDITKERLDDAVKRILTVKFEAGLFDRPQAQVEDLSVIGSNEHRALAREAVRKSQVLLKNENFILPISKDVKKIIISGSAANNLGRQAGGWTTEWQGIDGNHGIKGTTILEAIKNTVSSDTQIKYDEHGNFETEEGLAEIGIVVVGEKPYAEGWGDNANPSLSTEDITAIEKTRAKSKKILVVIISGRPLDISGYSQNWDGIVASWLPGSEAEGITDVLFGTYPFTGTLPINWKY